MNILWYCFVCINAYFRFVCLIRYLSKNGSCLYKVGKRENGSAGQMGHKLGGITRSKMSGRCKPKLILIMLAVMLGRADAHFTHRHRRTVSALHWRWGEGRKNSERSRACSHTSHSYSTRGPGTHSHLQRAPQTLVTVWTSAWGQLLVCRRWTQ